MSAEATENERVVTLDDYYLLDELLSDDERELRDRVREFGDREVLPIINDYWERAEFPFELVPKLAELNIAGTTIQGYGCPGMSRLAAGVVARELARADGSINTFFGVHSGLAMGAIDLLGSGEQKERWLPPMARLETIGAFGLTEPEHGSDSVSLETTVQRDGDEFILNGAKRWIGNASFADVVIIWARDEAGDVGAYLVEKGTAGFDPSSVIGGKIGKRAVWQAEISLTDVRVPADHKLATMAAATTAMQLYCFRLAQLQEAGTMTGSMASLAKLHNVRQAKLVCSEARGILGGNGLLIENHVSRHLTDMEIVDTYEGTDSIQSLIVGRD